MLNSNAKIRLKGTILADTAGKVKQADLEFAGKDAVGKADGLIQKLHNVDYSITELNIVTGAFAADIGPVTNLWLVEIDGEVPRQHFENLEAWINKHAAPASLVATVLPQPLHDFNWRSHVGRPHLNQHVVLDFAAVYNTEAQRKNPYDPSYLSHITRSLKALNMSIVLMHAHEEPYRFGPYAGVPHRRGFVIAREEPRGNVVQQETIDRLISRMSMAHASYKGDYPIDPYMMLYDMSKHPEDPTAEYWIPPFRSY